MKSIFTISVLLLLLTLSACSNRFKEPQVIPQPPHPTTLNKRLLKIDTKNFEKLTFDEAVKKYGEPYDTTYIRIEQSVEIGVEVIEKLFPNKEYETQEIIVLEAYWIRQRQSWYTVSYLKRNGIWKPIYVMLQV